MSTTEFQTKQCPFCGELINMDARKCKYCGEWLINNEGDNLRGQSSQPQSTTQTQVFVNQIEKKTNGLGTAGFIVSLVCAIFCWLPGVNFVLWFLGLLFSFIGIFKSPKGLAIAGLVISLIDLIVIVVLIYAVGAGLAAIFN